MTNLLSGRFDTAPDAAAFTFGASFRFDRRLFADDVTGSLAWARGLAKAGVLSSEKVGKEVFYWINKPFLEQSLQAVLEFIRERA